MDAGQADKRPPRIRIQQRAALAHQIGQIHQPVSSDGRLRRFLTHQRIRILAHLRRRLAFRLAELIPEPFQRQPRCQRAAHHGVRPGDGGAEGMHPALWIDLYLICVRKHHAGGADGGEGLAHRHHARAHGGGGIIPRPGGHHRARLQAGFLGSPGSDGACRIAAFHQGRQQRGVQIQCIQHSAGPAPAGHIQQIGAAGVAHFRAILPGQAEAHIILGQQNMPDLLPDFRFMPPHPQDFPGGEAGQRRVGGDADQPLPAHDPGYLIAFLLCAPIAPENGLAQHLPVFIQQHQPMHLPADAQSPDLGRGHTAFTDHLTNGFPGRLPPAFRILLRPAVPGLIQRIFPAGAGNGPALLIKEDGFGARCA